MRAAAALAASFVALGGCAVVFGLDEPTVRDGTGGGTTTGGSVGGSTAEGPGGGGGSSSSGDASSGSGGAACETASDCDDGNRCTEDDCDLGACLHTPTDDTEDPLDPHAPCETVTCEGGVLTFTNEPSGTACGSPPSTCDGDGRCTCDPLTTASCGPETACADPSCDDEDEDGTGVCVFGYAGPDTPVVDQEEGDCRRPVCTGQSAEAEELQDPLDAPTSPCGVCAENGGTGFAAPGTPCLGQPGVCDGEGEDASSCKVCIRTEESADVDLGCAAAFPHCDLGGGENLGCKECLERQHCATADAGAWCHILDEACACNGTGDCEVAANGPDCRDSVCGCDAPNDCAGSPRGTLCVGGNEGVCGCAGIEDCEESPRGSLCVGGACGCNDSGDCDSGRECNLATHRCE